MSSQKQAAAVAAAALQAAATPSAPPLPILTPTYLRTESMQTIAQSIPAVLANVPQMVTSQPSAAASGTLQPATVLSPFHPLTFPVAQHLAAHTEQRIKELVFSALAFMRHSNRTVLSTDDINLALRHKNAAPIYGFDNATQVDLLGVDSTIAATQTSAINAATLDPALAPFMPAEENGDLYMVTDAVVNFDDLLQQPLPAAPTDPTFSLHWLAIDGVQPLIPQNPLPVQDPTKPSSTGTSAVDSSITKTSIVEKGEEKEVVTKAPIKHVLSKEQQLYYDYVTSALRGTDETLKKAVYNSLKQDDGLYQLLPYFTQFIATEVSHNLHNLTFLTSLMKMTRKLIQSPYLHIEPYLQQILPAVMTCIVGRQLCLEPFEEHWSLRDFAAEILLTLTEKYAHAYPSMLPRITKTLVAAWLDKSKSMNTHYGCIVALKGFGPRTTKQLIVPFVKSYVDSLRPAMEPHNSDTTRMEASRVYHALLQAVGMYVSYEAERAIRPQEIADAIRAATSAASSTPANAAASASAMDVSDVTVKKEPSSSPEATNSKKRRRADPALAPLSAAASSSPSPTFVTNSELPDKAALEGIEMLMEVFGEALQPYLDPARLMAAVPSNSQATAAPAFIAASAKGRSLVIKKFTNASAADVFL